MKLGHYVIIQQGRRLIPGRNECRLFYRSALDRKTHELLRKSDDARLIASSCGDITYYVTDDLYRQIHALTFNKDDEQ